MKEEKEKKYRKAGIRIGAIISIVACILIATSYSTLIEKTIENTFDPPEWQDIARISSKDVMIGAVGEASVSNNVSGWLAFFCIDYAETPGTCLQSNASGGGYDSWGNVSGYVDADDQETDLKSEDPFYFAARGQFNWSHARNDTMFIDSRCRIFLTVSGDETISNVAGTAVVSHNVSTDGCIHINFYWDDGVDGYRIVDDGSLAWNLTIQAKY